MIVYVTEPVEYNLSSLITDSSKRELIPGELEMKCIALEMLEGLNFLNSTAKTIHLGLSPENVFITKEGRVKIGGLNFAQQFSNAEQLGVPLNYELKINEFSMVPNLKFAAPEITEKGVCSVESDLFSIGCIIYYMIATSKGKSPFILNMQDPTDKGTHKFEINTLEKRYSTLFAGFDRDCENMLRQLLSVSDPKMRGQLNQIVEKPWF
jgi:serine/threonine protein kinase